MSFRPTRRKFQERFAEVLQSVVLTCRYQHKHIANMTGATTKSVANWLSGNNAPAAEHLITLMREEDEIFFAILAMAERLLEELSEEQRFQFKQLLRLLQEKQCEP